MKDKNKRTCNVTCCSLAKCCGCTWSSISRDRKNKPLLLYACSAKKEERTCSHDLVILGNYGECVGCKYRVIAIEIIDKEGKHDSNRNQKIKLQT